ncbi:hypothetical protein COV18_01620 [Candidatus Woesearchaeota archaeon CG10_big_fil_rev_8_21_14_0_10_37_12]|nr:MAG: hypothetical protein COV18_01620 [Candidatus Woesearchaeota archaeon CG10_big_fil_rev_8_21_14_0_10_37_12]
MTLTIYQIPNCPFCKKVRRKLDELKLEYETIDIDPISRPDIVMENSGTVPVLIDDGKIIPDSTRILEYLGKKYKHYEEE